jgi:hypothetical protein
MGRPTTLDDDFGLDLPDGDADDGDERDTVGTADDTWNPDDDSDLGLDDLDGPEDVGLDTATGLDDGTDADLDLDETGEDERWTADSEEADELADDDEPGAADATEHEYGWLGDDEPSTDDEAFDPDLRDDEAPIADDGGAEGLDDDSDLDGVDDDSLPRLDASAEEDAPDDPTFEGIDDLNEPAGADDAWVELAGQQYRKLSERSVRTTPLTGDDGPAMVIPGRELELDEDGVRYRYACVLHGTAWWFVRSALTGAAERPLAIAPIGEDVGEPLALSAVCVEGLVTLRVRGTRGGAVLEASLDGEDLA